MQKIFPSPFSLRFNPKRLTGAIDWHGHLCFAAWLLELARPKTLVELGVFRGDSLATFAQAARELSLDLVITGVDSWAGDETTGKYSEQVYSEVKDYFDGNHPNVAIFRGLFDSALPTFSDGSIDLLHIDGCHHYEAVKHDFETWLPKLSTRGVILFHDISVVSGGFGTKRFWDEVKDTYPSFSFSHSNGLGILLCGHKQPEALRQLAADRDTLEVIRAAFEATGEKFFHMAKEKYWQGEANKHAAYVTHITGDIGQSLAQTVIAQFTAQMSAYIAEKSDIAHDCHHQSSLIRRVIGSILHRIGLR